MVHGDLARRTASDKFFINKAFNIAEKPKYNGFYRDLSSMVYKFFDKKNPKVVVLIMALNKLKHDRRITQTHY